MNPLDPRRNAYRHDLAAESLRGRVAAPRFAAPVPKHVKVSATPLRRAPDVSLGYETELLAGEIFDVYAIENGFAWGQARRDSYVGYCLAEALGPPMPPPTHRVLVLRSFLYPGPGMKTTPVGYLPYGAEVAVEGVEGDYLKTPLGFAYTAHLVPLSDRPVDPVGEAERFLGVPYLWGGKSSLGIDCSGLVQSACFMCGIVAPRDSDMQEAELGTPFLMPNDPANLPRGTLLFWPGHVALSQGNGRMIHANAFHMQVVSEEITPALARIESKGPGLRSVRILPGL
ncbi:MAG: NlpC/P60 family protein [Rhabdaerophilum sp.]